MALEIGTINDHEQHGKSPTQQQSQPESNVYHHHFKFLLQTPKLVIIFSMVAFSCLLLYNTSSSTQFSAYNPFAATKHRNSSEIKLDELKNILKEMTRSNNTVIITILNDVWAEPNSMFDLFLESFRIGNQTHRFLKHLVAVALDQKAYVRCLKVHSHCYYLGTNGVDFSEEAYFMTANYLKMMWRRIDFLRTVLNLGYDFLFTDADIMWFRDPFPHFHMDGDFQIACDYFRGNPSDLNNLPNGGFTYVKSNNKTIQFYKFWYDSRLTYPGLHDQDVFNKIKYDPLILENGLQIRFLDTSFFGGFCEPSRDFDKVCTMHANCCVGLDNKVHDLGIMLEDWRKYMHSFVNQTELLGNSSWTVPQSCKGSLSRLRVPNTTDDGEIKS